MVKGTLNVILLVAAIVSVCQKAASQEGGGHVSIVLLRPGLISLGRLANNPLNVPQETPGKYNPADPAQNPNAESGTMGGQNDVNSKDWEEYEKRFEPKPTPSPSPSGGKSQSAPTDNPANAPQEPPRKYNPADPGQNPNAESGTMGGQNDVNSDDFKRFDKSNPPKPEPSPSPSNRMQILSYAHLDNITTAPAVVDRPGVAPDTSDSYVSSVRSRAIAVIQKLPANVDVALISLDTHGAVAVQTHDSSDMQVETSKDKELTQRAKTFAGMWSNALSARGGLPVSSTSSYEILLVRSLPTSYSAAVQQMDGSTHLSPNPTATELTDHVSQVASQALANISKQADRKYATLMVARETPSLPPSKLERDLEPS